MSIDHTIIGFLTQGLERQSLKNDVTYLVSYTY